MANDNTHDEKGHEDMHEEKGSPGKVKKPAAARAMKSAQKSATTWRWVSVIMAALLFLSVVTGGFSTEGPTGMDTGIDEGDKSLLEQMDTVVSRSNDQNLTSKWNAFMDEFLSIYQEQENTAQDGEPTTGNVSASGSVSMSMYVMSQCPYGTQVVDAIAPVKEQMGDALDLNIEYIFSTPERYGEQSSRFCVEGLCSMHGISEVKGDIVQLCAIEHNPDTYLDMLTCMNENANNIPENWESCAEDNGLDVEAIRECYNGDEGIELAEESAAKAADQGATASPTLFLNGEKYQGSRSTEDFMRAICNEYETRPDACSDIPEPTAVSLTIVNDERCDNCDTSRMETVMRNLFPGVQAETYDVSSDKGQELVETYNLEMAPSYILGPKVTETKSWKNQQQIHVAFEEIDGSYKLKDAQSQASWYIDDEKRAEEQAKKENYPQENLDAMGYHEEKPRLDYFVMAFCPYGNPADEAASELHNLFGEKVSIQPHYILSVNGDTIQSLHGEQEGNQGIRELCALEELGKEAFFNFTLAVNEQCSSSNADSCWEGAAESAGVDVEAIKACMDERKITLATNHTQMNSKLVSEDSRTGELRQPGASPTFLINGKTYSGARDANSLKDALCEQFDTPPAECQESIESQANAPASGSC